MFFCWPTLPPTSSASTAPPRIHDARRQEQAQKAFCKLFRHSLLTFVARVIDASVSSSKLCDPLIIRHRRAHFDREHDCKPTCLLLEGAKILPRGKFCLPPAAL